MEPHCARDVVQILQALDGEYGQSCYRCGIAPALAIGVPLAVGVTKDVTAVVTTAYEIVSAVLSTWLEPVGAGLGQLINIATADAILGELNTCLIVLFPSFAAAKDGGTFRKLPVGVRKS